MALHDCALGQSMHCIFVSSLGFESLCTAEVVSSEALLHTVNMVHVHQIDIQLFHKMIAVEALWPRVML